MIVLDASAAIDYSLDTIHATPVVDRMSSEQLRAPDIVDFEVLASVRRLTLANVVDSFAAELAFADFAALEIKRTPSGDLLARAFELRHSVSAGDALYVSLAEILRCPLVTTDGRLARSHGHEAAIELIR